MNARVVFAEERLKRAFIKLKDSKTEDRKLYEWLDRAFDDLQEGSVLWNSDPEKAHTKGIHQEMQHR